MALLPGYEDAPESSLISMIEHLVRKSQHESSGFYLHDLEALIDQMVRNERDEVPTILWGVSHALLDLSEGLIKKLKHTQIIETGGMKGKRAEMTKSALHHKLKSSFDLPVVHSEYGMTELFSQAYSQDEYVFYPPQCMRILTREVNDPFQLERPGKTGVLHVIDLANIHTCSFIATEDIGKVYENGSFEVIGRLQHSEVRGCNMLYAI